MSELYNPHNDPKMLRDKMIGLGDGSIRKSYYPQLCQRIEELEVSKARLEENSLALVHALDALRQEQKRAADNERTFHALFEQNADGVLLADYHTRKLFLANHTMLRMLGCAAVDLQSLGVGDIFPEDEHPQIEEAYCTTWQPGETRSFNDISVLRRDGSVFFADVNSTLIEMAGRRYVMGVFRDMTERKQTEAAVEEAHLDTVLALARAVDARDAYTGNHSQHLAELSEQVARRLGCTREEIRSIHWAAMLHDIGKLGVPDEILRKPGPLNYDEWLVMKRHPETGAAILGPSKRLRGVARVVRAHHERWDGMGYPDGLRGAEIPLGARIIAVVDAYGAITDNRVYRKARSHSEAVQELLACAGTQFDPQVVQVFVEVVGE